MEAKVFGGHGSVSPRAISIPTGSGSAAPSVGSSRKELNRDCRKSEFHIFDICNHHLYQLPGVSLFTSLVCYALIRWNSCDTLMQLDSALSTILYIDLAGARILHICTWRCE